MAKSAILSALLFGLMFVATIETAAQERRPCGPSSLNGPLKIFIPQGAAGVSFKSACVQHDRCYATFGSDKVACDEQFLYDLNCACNGSRIKALR